MALHTETYLNILKRWCALVGIEYADLLSNESELFTQFGQGRLRKIWFETDWPDTINVSEELLVDQTFTVGASVANIFGIYESNPFSTVSTSFDSYRYRRMQDSLYVYGTDVPDYVYMRYKERPGAFATATDTVPYRFAEYIAYGAAADYMRVEQNGDSANTFEGTANQKLLDELEIHERDEHANQWDVGVQVYRPSL